MRVVYSIHIDEMLIHTLNTKNVPSNLIIPAVSSLNPKNVFSLSMFGSWGLRGGLKI